MTRVGFHCHDLDDIDTVITSNGLKRGEFYNFPSGKLPELKREIEQRDVAASVHAPLVQQAWYPMPPTISFLCDVAESRREVSLRMVRETVKAAKDFHAEYVVAHFPAPCTDPDGADDVALRDIAWSSASALAEMSDEADLPIHIEGFGPSPFLTVDFLQEVTRTLPALRYCFDTGHMHIAAQREGFDLYDFARQIATHVGSIHLWNNRSIEDYFAYRHIPVHPSQKPDDGWVDMPRILHCILSENPSCHVILESGTRYPQALGGHDFREGVEWVKELVDELS